MSDIQSDFIFFLVIAPKPVQHTLSPGSAIACYSHPALHLDLACHQNHMITSDTATVGPRPLDSGICRGSRKRAPSAKAYWCRAEMNLYAFRGDVVWVLL